MALGPINYQMQVATPFESVLQGMNAGAQLANVEMARQQQAVQMEAMRQKAALEQQAAQRAAANEAELQQLQSIPLEQMNQAQQARYMQLTNSEATRAFIARRIEQVPVTVMTNRMRGYASTVNALMMDPAVGVRRLQQVAEGEQDPEEKKALETVAQVAETNPLYAARMIHGMITEVGTRNKEVQGYSDAVVNFLDRVGKPLYPKEPGKPLLVPPNYRVLQDGQVVFEAPPAPPSPGAPTETERLTERLSDPTLTPQARQAIEGRLRILTTREPPREPREAREPVVQAVDPDTGRTIFVTQSEALSRRLSPASSARPETPNVSEQQASTATRRLLQRAKEINAAVQRTPKSEAPTAVEAGMENTPLLSRATNLVRSTDRQIVASAQDDVLDALLYLATGAAYNKEQLQQQKSAYLPVWSDDPATRAAKRQRLAQAIEGARVRAGRAWTPELEEELNKLLASPTMQSGAGAAPAGTGQWRLLPTTPR
jgi:hypothetical protein